MNQPTQIGDFPFARTPCATNVAYGFNKGLNPLGGERNPVAYVDYFVSECTSCGTKPLILNLNYAFSVDGTPKDGEYDLQGLLSDEFGHVFGLPISMM